MSEFVIPILSFLLGACLTAITLWAAIGRDVAAIKESPLLQKDNVEKMIVAVNCYYEIRDQVKINTGRITVLESNVNNHLSNNSIHVPHND